MAECVCCLRFLALSTHHFPQDRWSKIETTGCQRHITENVRIYICTPQKNRSIYNGAPMGPCGLSRNEWVCMCARWISSSKSLSCYYLLCEKNLWEHQQKRQYQQFHTKDQITELRVQKPLCWMKTNAYAQHHISKATQTCTNTQQAHAHHMQSQSMEGITIFFPLSQIRQDQIISLLWCQFSAV